MNEYIRSDLMRYYGKYDNTTLVKALMSDRTFRFQCAFRLCQDKGIKKMIGNIFFLEKNKINSEEVYKVLRVFVAIIILLLVSMKTRDTFYEKEINKNMYSLEIIDTTEVCAEALESFYEDSKYISVKFQI